MSDFRLFRGDARIWAVLWLPYCIPLEYRVFLATCIKSGSFLQPQAFFQRQNPPKNQSKSVGQGCCFEPLFRLPGAGSRPSDIETIFFIRKKSRHIFKPSTCHTQILGRSRIVKYFAKNLHSGVLSSERSMRLLAWWSNTGTLYRYNASKQNYPLVYRGFTNLRSPENANRGENVDFCTRAPETTLRPPGWTRGWSRWFSGKITIEFCISGHNRKLKFVSAEIDIRNL